MSQSMDKFTGDPSQLTIRQKVEIFERPLYFVNNLSSQRNLKKTSSEKSLNMTSTSNNNTGTASLSFGSSYNYSRFPRKIPTYESMSNATKTLPIQHTNSYPNKFSDKVSRIINENKNTISYYKSPDPAVDEGSGNMKEFHDTINDLNLFLSKELNEKEIQKRIGLSNKEWTAKAKREHENHDEKILVTLQNLMTEINEIKQNQKEFELKIRKQEEYQYMRALQDCMNEQNKNKKDQRKNSKPSSDSQSYDQTSESEVNKKISFSSKKINSQVVEQPISKQISKSSITKGKSNNVEYHSHIFTSTSYSREERIRKLETEVYKEETLMMKINRVLENIKNIEDKNMVDIINIERHYLVASTRFQCALSELRKLNDGIETTHPPPYNRKGHLVIRDIMLEIKPSYFEHHFSRKNEFLLILMKYEDKVFATKPMRIIDDVRVMKFSEKFSIPEIYIDFEMRLEIYGTTFWRKNSSVRDTMLKKYGFITFTLSDTGNKSKRFQMIEVLQNDIVPIKSKVLMKISQKITTSVQYKGNLFVKLRDVWYDAYGCLNGHLLEISFKKIYNTGITQSQETMLLDLFNVDSDAVIPVDVQRISDKPYTFLLKFNHYVDVTNFYLMLAAESSDSFSEWINALNKILVLIK